MCIVRTLSQFHTSFQVRSKNVYRSTFEFFDRKKNRCIFNKSSNRYFSRCENITRINSVFIIFSRLIRSIRIHWRIKNGFYSFKRIADGKKSSGRTLHFESVKINMRLYLNIYLQSREFQCALVAIWNLCYSNCKWN